MSTMMEKLQAMKEEANKAEFIKTDWSEITFKPEMGETRVRIIPNINQDELFFHADGYHVMSATHYQDCLDPHTCPMCKMLKKLWSDEDVTRQAVYRSLKRKKRFTYQVVLLNKDGSVKDTTPKLYTAPKTLHDIILAKAFENIDVTELDLIIKKQKGSPYVTYENSYFVDAAGDVDYATEEVKALDLGKKYTYEKSAEVIRKNIKQFDLGPTPKDDVPKKEEKRMDEDELDDFEKALLKELDS